MPIVSKAGFIAELNRRLLLHPAYRPGMTFTHYPAEGSVENATGYDWVPRIPGNPQPFAAIAHEVMDEGWGIA